MKPIRPDAYPQILASAWQKHLEPRPDNALTVVSTFAGCGGSSLGYSMAGFRELLAVECDDNAVETFNLNFTDVPVYHGDICQLTTDEVLRIISLQAGQLDLLDGSPPCQGFSTSGRREFDDPRNQLFKEYVRLLEGLQPKAFVMENVSGLVKGKMKLIFAEMLKDLKAAGYLVKAWLMNAKYFNVPQSRERMIFIGIREDLNIESVVMCPQSRIHTARDAFYGLSETIQDESIDHIWIDEVARQTKWIERAKNLRQGQKLVPGVASSKRAWWNRPLPTIQKNTMPGQPPYVRNSTIHPSQPRTLSIREMARGQSIPDEFRFVDALHYGMQRIGNSVPPMFMKAIAEHVRGLLGLQVERIS